MQDQSIPWVDFSIERGPVYGELKNRVGMKLTVKARPELEQFMQQMSSGKTVPVNSFSEDWVRVPKGLPLDVYAIDFGYNSKLYTLNAIGGPLLIDPNQGDGDGQVLRRAVPGQAARAPEQQVNLSFLTLAGISGDPGITIGLSGVYSWEYIQNARNTIPAVIRQFLQDYIVPVTINLSIVQRPGW